MLLIRNVYPGSYFFCRFIPNQKFFHPRSRIRIKEFHYFNPKNCFLALGVSNMVRVVHPGRIWILIFYPCRIQGSTRHRIPDPGSQHWTQLAFYKFFSTSKFGLVWSGCAAAEAERCGERVELGGALHRPGAPPPVHHPPQGHRHRQGDLCQSCSNQGCLAQIHRGESAGTGP